MPMTTKGTVGPEENRAQMPGLGDVPQMEGGSSGGSYNNIDPLKDHPAEPAGQNTPGAGRNPDLFDSFSGTAIDTNAEVGEEGSTTPGPAAYSNVNEPYPSKTLAPTGAGWTGGKGNVNKGYKGSSYK